MFFIFTVLFIIPGIYVFALEQIGETPELDEIRVYVKVAYLLNTLNIVAAVLIFQREVRSAVFRCRKKNATHIPSLFPQMLARKTNS